MIEQILKAKAAYKKALKDYVTLSYYEFDEIRDKMLALDSAPKATVQDAHELCHLLVLVNRIRAENFISKNSGGKMIRMLDATAFPIDRILGPNDYYTCAVTAIVDGQIRELEVKYKPNELLVQLVEIAGLPVGEFCAKHKVNLERIKDDADCDYTTNYKPF